MADLNIGNSSASVVVNAKHNGSVIPQIDNTYDLGTSELRWKNIYGNLKGNADTATTATNLASAGTWTWTGGTTAGPTASLVLGGKTTSIGAIPSASSSASGIITIGTQTIAGQKTFTSDLLIKKNTPHLYIIDRNTGVGTFSVIHFGSTNASGITNEDAATIFLNGPQRTNDGGANLMTIRNNVGDLRLNNNVINTGRLTIGQATANTNYTTYSAGRIGNPDGLVSFVQNNIIIGNTTDFNTLVTPGCYKVQMSAWGAAETYHSPNEWGSIYPYGLLFVFRGSNADTERRVHQIYFPHQTNALHPILNRMHNGSDMSKGWQAWTRMNREMQNGIANRIAYYNNAQTILSGNNIWTNGTKLGVNTTTEPSYQFYVNGTSYFTNYLQTTSYFKSTVTTGTAPVQVNSTTLNTNLNADLLDGYHENYFLRYRDLVSGSGGTSHSNSLWSQIGIRQYHNDLPDAMADNATYLWGAVISLPGTNSRLDIWYNHQASENGDGLRYRTGWNDDKKAWATILDSVNYTKYTVTKTGVGASGIWGINISGNAATATNADKLTTSGHLDTVEKLDTFIESNKLKYATVASVGGVNSDGMIISVPWNDSSWGHQVFLDDSAMVIQHRHRYTKTNSDGSTAQAWSGWATLLDSNNYNNYAPTRTGGGASGTWDVSISGSSKNISYHSQLTTNDAIDAFNIGNVFQVSTWNNTSSPGVSNGIIINAGWTNATYGAQIAIDDDPTYFMALRQRGSDGWNAWKRIPMGDGTGASGTWGISINGNAATSTISRSLGRDETMKVYGEVNNEVNFGGTNNSSTIYFGYRAKDSKPIPSKFIFGGGNGTSELVAAKVYGAVWNDYAEYRSSNITEPGRVIIENGDGTLSLSTERLQRGAEIISDTFGFSIGETDECKTPIAATGRVLAYTYEPVEEYKRKIGWPVCSGPNGTISIMTEEEEEKYPSRIIGTVSEIPTYEKWGTGNVEVNGRIWIRIR